MELMGTWNRGEVAKLVPPAENPPAPFSLVPVPGIEGAAGDPGAALGGGDGFGCSADAPTESLELLEYVMSEDVQKRFAATVRDPDRAGAEAGTQRPGPQADRRRPGRPLALVQLWLDTAFGPTVGHAMNDAIVNLFGGGARLSRS